MLRASRYNIRLLVLSRKALCAVILSFAPVLEFSGLGGATASIPQKYTIKLDSPSTNTTGPVLLADLFAAT